MQKLAAAHVSRVEYNTNLLAKRLPSFHFDDYIFARDLAVHECSRSRLKSAKNLSDDHSIARLMFKNARSHFFHTYIAVQIRFAIQRGIGNRTY